MKTRRRMERKKPRVIPVYNKTAQKKYKDKKHNQGFCRSCASRPHAPGKSCCEECLSHKRFNLIGRKSGSVEKLLAAQEGKCALCGRAITLRSSKLDHCHRTMRVRGLLCNNCNIGLGVFRDDPDLLNKAIDYLRR